MLIIKREVVLSEETTIVEVSLIHRFAYLRLTSRVVTTPCGSHRHLIRVIIIDWQHVPMIMIMCRIVVSFQTDDPSLQRFKLKNSLLKELVCLCFVKATTFHL